MQIQRRIFLDIHLYIFIKVTFKSDQLRRCNFGFWDFVLSDLFLAIDDNIDWIFDFFPKFREIFEFSSEPFEVLCLFVKVKRLITFIHEDGFPSYQGSRPPNRWIREFMLSTTVLLEFEISLILLLQSEVLTSWVLTSPSDNIPSHISDSSCS